MAPNVHQTHPPMYDMSRKIYVLQASSLNILLCRTAIIALTSFTQFCAEECLIFISSSPSHGSIILYYSTHTFHLYYRNIFVYILFLLFQIRQWWVFLCLLWTLARSTLRQYFYLYLTRWWWVFLACSCERLLGLLWGKTLLYNSTTLLTDDEFS